MFCPSQCDVPDPPHSYFTGSKALSKSRLFTIKMGERTEDTIREIRHQGGFETPPSVDTPTTTERMWIICIATKRYILHGVPWARWNRTKSIRLDRTFWLFGLYRSRGKAELVPEEMITKEPGLICIPSSIISMLIRNSGLWIMWIPDLFDGKIRWNPLFDGEKKHYFLIFWKKKTYQNQSIHHWEPAFPWAVASLARGARYFPWIIHWHVWQHGDAVPHSRSILPYVIPWFMRGVQDVQVWHSMTIPSHFSGISVNLECNWRMAFFQIHMAAIGFHGSWFICLQCGSGGLRAISWWSQFVGSNAAWKLLKLRTERASLQCKVGVCRWILMSSVRCRVM